jgi:hypothetical protein
MQVIMEAKPFYFISYSRTQLYYAESVAIQLKHEGIDVWFDLQQLKTGEDWASEIKRGLDECAGIVLIVSRRAMASPYVELEWKGTLDAGKPVYLLYFETATLTDERLTHCAAVDGRGRFQKAIHQLVGAIQNGETPKETTRSIEFKIPKLFSRVLQPDDDQVMRFPIKSSPGILGIALSILLMCTWLIIAGIIAVQFFGLVVAPLLFALAGYGLLAWNYFVRRKLVGEPPRLFMLLSVAACWFAAQYRSRAFFVGSLPPAVFPYSIGTALIFVAFYVLRGADLLRWTVTGFASRRARRRYHGGQWLNVNPPTTQPAQVQYAVYYHPGDEKFYNRLLQAMSARGHSAQTLSESHNIFLQYYAILSNLTDFDELRRVLQQHPSMTPIAVTSVTVPKDIMDLMGRFQWLDARRDPPERFNALAKTLGEGGLLNNTLSASLEVTPSGLDTPITPRSVVAALTLLRLWGVGGVAVPIFLLLLVQFTAVLARAFQFSPVGLLVQNMPFFLFAIVCLALDYLARYRRISATRFSVILLVGLVASQLVGNLLSTNGFQLIAFLGTLLVGLVVAGVIILFVRSWLPSRQPEKTPRVNFREPIRYVARNVIGATLAILYTGFVAFSTLSSGEVSVQLRVLLDNYNTLQSQPMRTAEFLVSVPNSNEYGFIFERHILTDSIPDERRRTQILNTVNDLTDELQAIHPIPITAQFVMLPRNAPLLTLMTVLFKMESTPDSDTPTYANDYYAELFANEDDVTLIPVTVPLDDPNITMKSYLLGTYRERGNTILTGIIPIDTPEGHFFVYVKGIDTPENRDTFAQMAGAFRPAE